MARGLMERVLAAEKLDALFETTAHVQYTRYLLFSSVVDLMSLVDEVQATYRGMMIAIEPPFWSCFATSSLEQLLETLHHLAAQVHLSRFLKQPRAAKKPKPRPKRDPKQGHVSTQRLLQKKKNAP